MAFRSERAVIMRKLVQLEAQGCDIEVILTNADGDIISGLVSGGIPVHPSSSAHAAGTLPQVIVHNKFWLVDAKSTDDRRRAPRSPTSGRATGAATSSTATTCSCASSTTASTTPTARTGS